MKKEKLSQELGNIDNELLDAAWEIDNAQKLKAYGKKKTPPFRWVAVAACAAMLALVILITGIPQRPNDGPTLPIVHSSGRPHKQPDGNQPPVILKPPVFDMETNLQVNSIDKLNYYAALRVLEDTPAPVKYGLSAGNYGITFLTNGSGIDLPEITVPGNTEGPPVNTSPSSPTDPSEDIVYYELNPNEPFYVNNISMFQIQLTDANGFLASKLGLGIVDIVITEDCIWGESLITFRNGEKFYSCLTNGWSLNEQTRESQWDFSTHKYIEGFYIVKNGVQENYAFEIFMDAEGQATEFICREAQNGGYRPDQNVKIASTTVISTEGGSYTIADLENYFNNAGTV